MGLVLEGGSICLGVFEVCGLGGNMGSGLVLVEGLGVLFLYVRRLIFVWCVRARCCGNKGCGDKVFWGRWFLVGGWVLVFIVVIVLFVCLVVFLVLVAHVSRLFVSNRFFGNRSIVTHFDVFGIGGGVRVGVGVGAFSG